eukprot:TRINITY_DN62184_c0_g1_i1.p1 TRINITY_DN62184_c0_g1~~TRINITY_DN62184_c0_g1_i1.p1  ORF type:complete len:654 (+),score=356.19 TRINITY_DN62184_c0_g1_i1:113-2074(+)
MSAQAAADDCKSALKRRILAAIGQVRGDSDTYLVLVVDEYAAKILSSACRMFDILDSGCLALEKLELGRERLDMPALYFLEPSDDSIDRLIADFAGKKPQYSDVHVFFTSRCDDDLMERIGESKVADHIVTLKELNADFIAAESRVYHFNRNNAIPAIFFPPNEQAIITELSATAHKIASLCLTLNEYPYIMYRGQNKACEFLAKFVEDDLNKLVASLPDWQFNSQNRATLLITDRSLDVIAPLLHEVTYQAMAHDLLDINGEILKLPKEDEDESKDDGAGDAKKKKKANDDKQVFVLSEDDALWVEFRHEHFARVLSGVSKKFRAFQSSNALAKLQGQASGNIKVEQMRQALADAPEYQQLASSFVKHISIASKLSTIYSDQLIDRLGELEQSLATNLTGDLNTPKSSSLSNQLSELCGNPKVTVYNKLRIIMLYMLSQGKMKDSSRNELFSVAGINYQLQKAVRNLKHLGVDLNKKLKIPRDRIKQFKERANESNLVLDRYIPELHTIITSLVQGQLQNDSAWPYVKEPPPAVDAPAQSRRATGGVKSVRKRGQWRNNSAAAAEEKDEEASKSRGTSGPRYIIFCLGGMTLSEMRTCYQVSQQLDANCIIGSSSILTPENYIKGLAEVPLDADPNAADDDDELTGIKIDDL